MLIWYEYVLQHKIFFKTLKILLDTFKMFLDTFKTFLDTLEIFVSYFQNIFLLIKIFHETFQIFLKTQVQLGSGGGGVAGAALPGPAGVLPLPADTHPRRVQVTSHNSQLIVQPNEV